MTATIDARPPMTVRLVNRLLGIRPLFHLAKTRARQMMIQRAESMGVPWRTAAAALQNRDWQAEFRSVNNPDLTYPAYYLKSFHAYDEGNLGWAPATEVELAAYAVHAKIWPDAGVDGDPRLRQSFHAVLQDTLEDAPQAIVDLGCGVGMSTFALQDTFPDAAITGVDLSPYFLAVAEYRTQLRQAGQGNHLQLQPTDQPRCQPRPRWVHAAAESTGLPAASYDLVSACLVFHELPQSAARQIVQEAQRLLRPGGYFAIMDMNPQAAAFAQMPPYVMTLLKSTEPYMDEYFSLDLIAAIAAGFTPPKSISNTPRHRTIVAQRCDA